MRVGHLSLTARPFGWPGVVPHFLGFFAWSDCRLEIQPGFISRCCWLPFKIFSKRYSFFLITNAAVQAFRCSCRFWKSAWKPRQSLPAQLVYLPVFRLSEHSFLYRGCQWMFILRFGRTDNFLESYLWVYLGLRFVLVGMFLLKHLCAVHLFKTPINRLKRAGYWLR